MTRVQKLIVWALAGKLVVVVMLSTVQGLLEIVGYFLLVLIKEHGHAV